MPFKAVEHPKCPRCGKSVYAAEEMSAGGYKWHKFCFKCNMCNKLLDSLTAAEHLAELYCRQCHGRKYGPKGVGFGIGAGALTMDTGEQFGNREVEMTVVQQGIGLDSLLSPCTDNEIYCKTCYGRKYGPKGVGFGLGAGALSMDHGERFGNKAVTNNRPMTAEAFTAPINPQHS